MDSTWEKNVSKIMRNACNVEFSGHVEGKVEVAELKSASRERTMENAA